MNKLCIFCFREFIDLSKKARKSKRSKCSDCKEQRVASNRGRVRSYLSWFDMKRRCLDVSSKDYHNYGARGITIDPLWLEFKHFYKEMGDRPKGLTLDRIDNNRGYEPGNCRWANQRQQSENRRTSRMLTFNGKTQSMTAWAREMGMSYHTVAYRVYSKWPIEKVLDPSHYPATHPKGVRGSARGW